jgi:HlyD family secretion protein
MMMRPTHLMLAPICLAVLTAGCSDNEKAASGSGFIETDEVLVSSEVTGRVMEKYFTEGSVVGRGDILLAVDPTRITLQIKSAQASLGAAEANLNVTEVQLSQAMEAEKLAESEFQRVTDLLKSGTANQRQYDRARFEYDSAQKSRQIAEARIAAVEAEIEKIRTEMARLQRELDDTTPESPIAGTVLEEYIDIGELLSPGRPITTIAGLDTVTVKIFLGAGPFAGIRLGDRAVVDTESGGKTFHGMVVWTSDKAEFTPENVQTKESRAGLVYAVKVSIPNPEHFLKVGMPVYVTLESR